MTNSYRLTPHDVRRLAAAADCCDRTARRFVEGRAVREDNATRLRVAVNVLGFNFGGQLG